MPTTGELAVAETWLYSTLNADSTITAFVSGGIHSKTVLEATEPPYIVFINKTPGVDLEEVGQNIIWTAMRYDVQLVVEGNDIITPDPVYKRITQLLHKGSGTTSGGAVISCTRTRVDDGNSLEAGVEYRHMTQSFELLIQTN